MALDIILDDEQRKDIIARRTEVARKCFNWICDRWATQIAEVASSMPPDSVVVIYPKVDGDEEFRRATITYSSVRWLKQVYIDCFGEAGIAYVESNYALAKARQQYLVYCKWNWHLEGMDGASNIDEAIEYLKSNLTQPIDYLGFVPKPFSWGLNTEAPFVVKKEKTASVPEKSLEHSLLDWLHAKGIKADNQISTSRHRTDIWIPGKCFLELKKSKISGDDVCQAMDYCTEYKKPIVLVGNHISEMASRGIEAFNKAVESEMVVFVSWSAVRTYLKGLLCIQ
jgi:hypothetical protein